jgi:hypothetical protein
MSTNYANEPIGLRNIVEATAGINLWKAKNLWLDAGVFGSPFTNESYFSKDHLVYTRSMSAEFVPYYISGVEISMPLSPKVNASLYLINGWQVIQRNSKNKSVATQIEWRPNDNLLVNWNTYTGNEQSELQPTYGMRYFSDVFTVYNKGWFSGTAAAYLGLQQYWNDSIRGSQGYWYSANLTGRVRFNPKWSLSGRVEYFDDPSRAVVTPITDPVGAFNTSSGSLCLNYAFNKLVLIRLESRTFYSHRRVYLDQNQRANSWDGLVVASMAALW